MNPKQDKDTTETMTPQEKAACDASALLCTIHMVLTQMADGDRDAMSPHLMKRIAEDCRLAETRLDNAFTAPDRPAETPAQDAPAPADGEPDPSPEIQTLTISANMERVQITGSVDAVPGFLMAVNLKAHAGMLNQAARKFSGLDAVAYPITLETDPAGGDDPIITHE